MSYRKTTIRSSNFTSFFRNFLRNALNYMGISVETFQKPYMDSLVTKDIGFPDFRFLRTKFDSENLESDMVQCIDKGRRYVFPSWHINIDSSFGRKLTDLLIWAKKVLEWYINIDEYGPQIGHTVNSCQQVSVLNLKSSSSIPSNIRSLTCVLFQITKTINCLPNVFLGPRYKNTEE